MFDKSINDASITLLRIAYTDPSVEVETYNTSDYLTNGLVFINEKGQMIEKLDKNIVNKALGFFGLSQISWNNTFHKSLEKVAFEDLDQLYAEQMINYLSTYGMEYVGLKANPYIPVEAICSDLNAQANTKAFSVIRVYEDLNNYMQIIYDFLSTSRSISDQLKLDSYSTLIKLLAEKSDEEFSIDNFVSFELRCLAYAVLNKVPTDSIDWMRFVLYRLTGSVLLVKNTSTINALKSAAFNSSDLKYYFQRADLAKLAESFYRLKPFFLALKSNNACKSYVNKIRRLAYTHHKPICEYNMRNASALIKHGLYYTAKFQAMLAQASTRELIKLYNYLNNISADVRIYKIRNGKKFVQETDANSSVISQDFLEQIEEDIICILADKLKDKLAGKTFYIPEYIEYVAPVSEKQFFNNLPNGTKLISNTDAFSVGICWEDLDRDRVDLDLHLVDTDKNHYGWNGLIRSSDENNNQALPEIIYSGDMTSAGSEAFYIKHSYDKKLLLSVNNFNHVQDASFKFMLTEKRIASVDLSHNNLTAPISISDAMFTPIDFTFDNKYEISIGFLYKNACYLYASALSGLNIPNEEYNKKYLDGIVDQCINSMKLATIIELAGGCITHDEQLTNEVDENIINLSPCCVTQKTFFDIIDG